MSTTAPPPMKMAPPDGAWQRRNAHSTMVRLVAASTTQIAPAACARIATLSSLTRPPLPTKSALSLLVLPASLLALLSGGSM
eukprot:59082-Prymnesium_polylepis.1